MKRRPPPFALIVAIAAFVLAQLMGAVHACDFGTQADTPAKAVAMTPDGSDCCDHGQRAPDPNCDNHCQQAGKAPERAQPTAMAWVASEAFIESGTPLRVAPPAPPAPPTAPALARPTGPSISIRNCCFRI